MTDKAPISIHIDLAATDEQKQSQAPLLDKCPHHNVESVMGFGLAGGGYGPYVFCPIDGCDYFAKLYLEDDEA
jgi:hypothetical protein